MNPIEALKAMLPKLEKLLSFYEFSSDIWIDHKSFQAIIDAIQALSGDVVVVPRDQSVLCPKCEGNKGFNVSFPDNKSLAYWEPCADCMASGKILASRLALMLSAATPPAESEMVERVAKALDEIRAHLGAAKMQRAPSDDKIIADHIDAAHLIANTTLREMRS